MEFIEIMDRVSLIVEKNLGVKPTDALVAKYLDISPTNFANMKKRNSIPFKEIAYFSAKHKVSINWVLFNQYCEGLVKHEEQYYSLRVIDKINASCGGGAFDDESIVVEYINLDKKVIEKLGYNNTNNLEAIKVIGDSMYPTLKEDELVLIDKSLSKYNSYDVFLVNTTNGLFVKRLKISDDKIELISDNQEYSNYTFCIDEVTIIGKVLGVLELNEEVETEIDIEDNAEKDIKNFEVKYNTGFIEFVNGEYSSFVPDDDMQNGYDPFTDELSYDLENNQFYVITMDCDIYDNLVENVVLELESSYCVLSPYNSEEYLFLFEDSYSYNTEREKLLSLINEENDIF